MKTQTASRPLAEATKLPNTRQPQARKTRQAKTARLNQPAKSAHVESLPADRQASTANPLRGLFSDEELRQIDERCRAMGRSAVDIVASALRDWVKGIAPKEKDQSLEWMKDGITHKSRDQALAEFTANLGEEMGRWEEADCSRHFIYRIGSTLFSVREAVEVFQRRKWHHAEEVRKSVGATDAAEFSEHLESLNPRHVRRVYHVEAIEPKYAAAAWLEQELPLPQKVSDAVRWQRECDLAERAKIAAEVRAEIMAETASVSPSREAQLARFDVLGEEIARHTHDSGTIDVILDDGTHYYWVFEQVEIRVDGEWIDIDEYHHTRKVDTRSLLAALPASDKRSTFTYEPQAMDEIAHWFDSHGISYPSDFLMRFARFTDRIRIEEASLIAKAIVAERQRIARAMNTALAA